MSFHHRLTLCAALLVLATGVTVAVASTEETLTAPDRSFEYAVRGPFFRGIEGDAEQFERAMRLCEDTLAEDPDHAEALVWHGAGLFFRAGQSYQKGDFATGQSLWAEGLEEMARAVELRPNDPSVRIPRGATLLAGSRGVPFPAQEKSLLELAVSDYEATYAAQSAYFDELSEHARGELLLGLLEGYHRLNDAAKIDEWLGRTREVLAGSDYLAQVERALGEPEGLKRLEQRTCEGCHH